MGVHDVNGHTGIICNEVADEPVTRREDSVPTGLAIQPTGSWV
jgi:hypothetical protein